MPMAIDCTSPAHITRWSALGFRCFTFSADTGYLDEGARAANAAARAAAT
jgi:2-keto-3-deoxy-L-rhamnonate aldolase RhmA